MDCEWDKLSVPLCPEILETLKELNFLNTTPVQVSSIMKCSNRGQILFIFLFICKQLLGDCKCTFLLAVLNHKLLAIDLGM